MLKSEFESMAGLVDTNTVDIVAQDEAGQYFLVMVETRPWGADPEQQDQLREKINAYAGFILEGGLGEKYPETAGKPVYIQLNCPEQPNGEIAAIIQHASEKLLDLGIDLRIKVIRRTNDH